MNDCQELGLWVDSVAQVQL